MIYGMAFGQEEVIKSDSLMALLPEEKDIFRDVIKSKVKDLELFISTIASKEDPEQKRLDAIYHALKLFIKPDSNIVEISSKLSNSKKNIFVKTYLHRLYSIQAHRVDITFYNIAHLDSLKRHTDGKYYGTAYIYQKTEIFFDEEDNEPDYNDQTVKKIDIILEPDDNWIANKNKPKYLVYLSDIRVVETI